jgi:biopolymer transport protein ExbD
MLHKLNSRFNSSNHSFNMTAVIDIVFLLIIFFLVVCQFIEAENFEVSVTDNCRFAEEKEDAQAQMATVTVMKNEEGKIDFAVGPDKIAAFNNNEAVTQIAQSIDSYLLPLPSDDKVVVLRIDEDICFADTQYALAGIAQSRAANIQLAVLKEKRPNLK